MTGGVGLIDTDGYAALLCEWCLEVAPGQQVLIASSPLATAALRALHRAILHRGAWPLLRISPTWEAGDFLAHAGPAQLDSHAPLDLTWAQEADAQLSILAPANTHELAGVDPALIARVGRARAPVQAARLSRRWCGTLWPTAALAQQAGMGEDEYATFVHRALFLDRPDPIAAWRELSSRQAELITRLAGAQEIRIEAEGTDLRLRVDGRTWVNSDGRRNMPSGEVFTGPREDSAEGTIRFTIPSSPRGVEVRGVELSFTRDKRVSAALGSDLRPARWRPVERGRGNAGVARQRAVVQLSPHTVPRALGARRTCHGAGERSGPILNTAEPDGASVPTDWKSGPKR